MKSAQRRQELREEIHHLQTYRKILQSDIIKMQERFGKAQNSHTAQKEILEKSFAGTSPHELLIHYDRCIAKRKNELRSLPAALPIEKFKAVMPLIILGGFLIAALILLRPQITGLVVDEQANQFYSDNISISLDDNQTILWSPDNPGTLESLKASGNITGYGFVRILVSDGETSKIVLEKKIEFDESNHSKRSLSQEGEEGIDLELKYGNHEKWDANNNGWEPQDGVIDISVAGSQFDFEPSEGQLCTLWNVESLDKDTLSSICFGKADCCSILDLQPQENTKWNDPLYIYAGRFGAGYTNNVHARLVYSQGLSEARFSDTEMLSADFEQPLVREFYEACQESCSTNLSASAYTITVELDGPTVFISSFTYLTSEFPNSPPELIKEIPDFQVFENGSIAIDLKEYVRDPDDSGLGVQVNKHNVSTSLNGSLLNITFPEQGEFTLFLLVSDRTNTLKTNKFKVTVSKRLAETPKPKIDPRVIEKLQKDVNARVILKLRDTADLSEEILAKQEVHSSAFGSIGFLPKKVQSGLIHHTQIEQLKNDSRIEEILLDQPVSLLLENAIPQVRGDLAEYNISRNGSGIKICLVDSGVDPAVISNYAYGYDFVNQDSNPLDDHGHGTAVASIIEALAPGTALVAAKVVNAQGQGYESDVLAGIQYCIDENSDIISLSIGSSQYTGLCDENIVSTLVNFAWSQGIHVVAAAGNDADNTMRAPACASNVTSVSAVNSLDEVWVNASINSLTHIVAPGVNINTIGLYGNPITVSGTSLSVPFVSAASALLQEAEFMTPTQLDLRLRQAGIPVEHEGNSYPRLDIANAVLNISVFNLTNTTLNESEPLDEGNYFVLWGDDNALCAYSTADTIESTCETTCGSVYNDSSTLFNWESTYLGNPQCCGDDLGETFTNKTCVQGCINSSTDIACCNTNNNEVEPKLANKSMISGGVKLQYHFRHTGKEQFFVADYSGFNNFGEYSGNWIDENGTLSLADHASADGLNSEAVNLSEGYITITTQNTGLRTRYNNGFTIEFFLKFEEFSGEEEVLYMSNDIGINLTSDANVTFGLSNSTGGWKYLNSTQNLSVDTWHFISATYDETNMTIYIDGVHSGSLYHPSSYINGASSYDYIGHPDNPLSVILDEFRIVNYSMSPTMVSEMYEYYNNTYLLCHFENYLNYSSTAANVKVYIYPIEDVYINGSNTGSRYYDEPDLRVGYGTLRTLIAYNTSIIPPENITVTLGRAFFWVWDEGVWGGITHAHRLFKPWAYTSASWAYWNNAQFKDWAIAGAGNATDSGVENSLDDDGADRTLTAAGTDNFDYNSGRGQYDSITITDLIQDWIDGTATYSYGMILLANNSNHAAYMRSMEHSNSSQWPYLEARLSIDYGPGYGDDYYHQLCETEPHTFTIYEINEKDGLVGSGVSFEQTNHLGMINIAEFSNRLEQGTVEFWVNNSEEITTNEGHFMLFGIPLNIVDGITVEDTELRANYNETADAYLTHNISDWQVGEWHHIAFTYANSNTAKLYVDGHLADNITGVFVNRTWGSNANYYTIGYPWALKQTFNSTVDEFRILTYARNESQILSDYIKGVDLVYNDNCVNSSVCIDDDLAWTPEGWADRDTNIRLCQYQSELSCTNYNWAESGEGDLIFGEYNGEEFAYAPTNMDETWSTSGSGITFSAYNLQVSVDDPCYVDSQNFSCPYVYRNVSGDFNITTQDMIVDFGISGLWAGIAAFEANGTVLLYYFQNRSTAGSPNVLTIKAINSTGTYTLREYTITGDNGTHDTLRLSKSGSQYTFYYGNDSGVMTQLNQTDLDWLSPVSIGFIQGNTVDFDGSQTVFLGAISTHESQTSAECCGDDPFEYYLSRICSGPACENSTSDAVCCNNNKDCVYDATCYSEGSTTTINGIQSYCNNSIWSSLPNLVSFSANDSSLAVGETMLIEADWSQQTDYATKLVVSNNISFPNCDYSTSSGCMCNSSPELTTSGSCTYTLPAPSEPGSVTYYVRICNVFNLCSEGYLPTTLNYTGTTNPSSLHYATYNQSDSYPISEPSSVGIEVSTSAYTNMSSLDGTSWNNSIDTATNAYFYVQYVFWANTSRDYQSIGANVSARSNVSSISADAFLYVWNQTEFSFVDWVVGEIWKNLSFFSSNSSDYLNGSNEIILYYTIKDDSTGYNVDTSTDYVGITLNQSRYGKLNYTIENSPPVISDYQDNITSDLIGPFEDVLFSASWSEPNGDEAMMLVSNSSQFTDCNITTSSGCMCNSSLSTSTSASCTWQVPNVTQMFEYYIKICDNSSGCTNFTELYTYEGITNPSGSHYAYSSATDSLSLTSCTLSGSEASDSAYSNVTSKDGTYWNELTSTADYLRYQVFVFNASRSPTKYASYNYSFKGHAYGFNDKGGSVNGIMFYTCQQDADSDGQYRLMTQTTTSAETDQSLNISYPMNATNNSNQIVVMIRTRGITGAGNANLSSDYSALEAYQGGYFTIQNQPPIIVSVSVNDTIVPVGGNISFTAYWDDIQNDTVQLFISNVSSFANCGPSDASGCWCNTSLLPEPSGSCNYTTTDDEAGTTRWYARLCDSSGACTNVYKHYNFSGATNPSTASKAAASYSSAQPPATLVSGSEASTTNYEYLASSDSDAYNYSYTAVGGRYEWQQFRFNLSYFHYTTLSNDSVSYNIIHDGFADTDCSAGIEFYFYNSTASAYSYLSENTADNWTSTNFTVTGSQGDYASSNRLLHFLTITRDFNKEGTAQCKYGTGTGESIHADYVAMEAWVGGELLSDIEAPSCDALSFADVDSSDYGYPDNTNDVFYYSNATDSTYRYRITLTVSDESGMNTTIFPNTTSAGTINYTSELTIQYVYNWSAQSNFSDAANITVIDIFGNEGNCSLNVTHDYTPPSGGSLYYTNGTVNITRINISLVWGSDDLTGVESSTLYESTADYDIDSGTCGVFSDFEVLTVVNPPTTTVPYINIQHSTCYNFTWEVWDKVHNIVNYTSPNITKTDFCSPNGDWDIPYGTVTCANKSITVNNLSISNGATLNLINVTLVAQNISVGPIGGIANLNINDSENIWLNGWLNVYNSDNFRLHNSTLRVNVSTTNGSSGVICNYSSYCEYTNSIITNGEDSDLRYQFRVNANASAYMSESNISYCGWTNAYYSRGPAFEGDAYIVNSNSINNWAGFEFLYDTNSILENVSIQNNTNYSLWVLGQDRANVTALNSYEENWTHWITGRLYIQWYFTPQIYDYSGNVQDATVEVLNAANQQMALEDTDSSGKISTLNVTEYYTSAYTETYEGVELWVNHSNYRTTNRTIIPNASGTYGFYLNTEPTGATPALSPSPVYEGEDLVCRNGSVTDLDGNATRHAYTWLLDGTSQLLINMPFDIESYDRGKSGVNDTVMDYSGFGHNGTFGNLESSNYPEWKSDGIMGGAYYFNAYGFINISDSTALSDLTDFSLDFWIKPNDFDPQYGPIFANTENHPSVLVGGELLVWLNNSDIYALADGTSIGVNSSGLLASDTWTHICLTMDAENNWTLYANGTMIDRYDTSEATFLEASHNFYIGTRGSYFSAEWYYDGYLDNFRLWNRTLSSPQCSQIFNETAGGYSLNATMLSNELSVGENWTCEVTSNDAWEYSTTYSTSELVRDLPTCGDELNATTVLRSNLTIQDADKPCFNITDNNVILDCAGYSIIGNYSRNLYAVFAQGVNNITIRNCNFHKWSTTIYTDLINNLTVYNNSIFDSYLDTVTYYQNIYAVYINASNSINLTRNKVDNISTSRSAADPSGGRVYGVYVNDSNNLNIDYLWAYDHQGLQYIGSKNTAYTWGLFVKSVSNISARHVSISNISDYIGINIDTSCTNVTLEHLEINDSKWAIYVNSPVTINNLSINSNLSGSSMTYGIQLGANANHSNISSFQFASPLQYALHSLAGTSYMNINDGQINNAQYGIYFKHATYSSDNSTYSNLNFTNCSTVLEMHGNYNSFSNINSEGENQSLKLTSSLNNNFTDSTFTPSTDATYFLYQYTTTLNTLFVNVSANYSNVSLDPAGYDNYTVQWYFRVNVTDQDSNPLEDAEVNVTDVHGNQDILENTTSGLTQWHTITQMVVNRTLTNTSNNHSINVTKPGYVSYTQSYNISQSETYSITLQNNSLPWALTPEFDPQPVYTDNTLNCTTTAYDNDSSSLTVEFTWYNLSNDGTTWEKYTSANISASNASITNYTLNPSEIQSRNETWNCTVRVFDLYNFSSYYSNSTYVNNSIPGRVNLTYPEDGDEFFTELQPNFNWTNATDADDDVLTYRIQLATDEEFLSKIFDVSNISTSNYTWSSELPFFTTYYWRVWANDSITNGSWSNISNFTLEPDLTLSLVQSSVDFGLMSLGEENDTTDEDPVPFKVQNDGNVFVNISINATSIWTSSTAPLNSSYYQFKANESSEPASFNWSASAQNWVNLSSELKECIAQLNYTNSSDLAYIDVRVESTLDEPPGEKNSTIEFQSRQAS